MKVSANGAMLAPPKPSRNGSRAPSLAERNKALQQFIAQGCGFAYVYKHFFQTDFTGEKNPQGWMYCHAIGRQDGDPSATVSEETGNYRDFTGDDSETISIWDVGVKLGVWPDVPSGRKAVADFVGFDLGGSGLSNPHQPSEQKKPEKQSPPGFRSLNALIANRRRAKKLEPIVYRYYSAETVCIGAVLRFDLPGGKKTFVQAAREIIDGKEHWFCRGMALPRVLYKLPLVLATEAPIIIVCEGEKDALAAEKLGYRVTTSTQGAKNAHLSDWSPLASKELVVIFRDNDDDGLYYAKSVAKLLFAINPKVPVKIVLLPGLAEKHGAANFLLAREGQPTEQIRAEADAAIEAAPFVTPADVAEFDAKPAATSADELPAGEEGDAGDLNAREQAIAILEEEAANIRFGAEVIETLPNIIGRIESLQKKLGQSGGVELEQYSLKELDAGDFRIEYAIRNVVPMGECGMISAPFKGSKTHVLGDMAVSLATATNFLGCDHFGVDHPLRAGLVTCESGKPAIQEMFRRICRARRINPADVENLFISTDCPQLPGEIHLVESFIVRNRLQFVGLDPAYLLFADVSEASHNDMAMGATLRVLTELGKRTGCTIALVAHNRKGRLQHQKKYDPPELAEIAHAGYAAWARWFVLLGTRKEFDSEAGNHSLHMRTLGSAGHSGLWALDIHEGRQANPGGRVWQVAVKTAAEVREQQTQEREQAEADRHQRTIDANVGKLRQALRSFPDGETAKEIREAAKLNSEKMAEAMTVLQGRGEVESCKVTKNGRQYDGIRYRDPWSNVGSGTSGTSGTNTGSSPACPSEGEEQRVNGTGPLSI
jgi:hypothetical protein